MTDNTQLNTGSGGDTIRDLARQSGTVKTQVTQLDLGGPTANAEVLITAGQQTSSASVPVVVASDQSAMAVSTNWLLQQILIELQLHSQLLAQGLNINDNLDVLRSDPALVQQISQQ